jgi:hypothetical protein
MNTRSCVLLACISTPAILAATTLSWALNEQSHELVVQEASSQSTLDTYLREKLGMPDVRGDVVSYIAFCSRSADMPCLDVRAPFGPTLRPTAHLQRWGRPATGTRCS